MIFASLKSERPEIPDAIIGAEDIGTLTETLKVVMKHHPFGMIDIYVSDDVDIEDNHVYSLR